MNFTRTVFLRLRTVTGTALAGALLLACTTTTNSADAAPGFRHKALSSGNCPATAAATQGWSNLAFSDDFSNANASLNKWWVYEGAGNGGNGRRSLSALSVAGGVLTFNADWFGTSGGIAQRQGYDGMYGRWETCVKSSVSAPAYHSVALLWPNDDVWPAGGEVDFMEMRDPFRSVLEYNLHYSAANNVEAHTRPITGTEWHSYAVEWTPARIAVFVDGVMWAQSTDTSRFPRGPMHLCLQLDNFGGFTFPGAKMFVDWAAQYRV